MGFPSTRLPAFVQNPGKCPKTTVAEQRAPRENYTYSPYIYLKPLNRNKKNKRSTLDLGFPLSPFASSRSAAPSSCVQDMGKREERRANIGEKSVELCRELQTALGTAKWRSAMYCATAATLADLDVVGLIKPGCRDNYCKQQVEYESIRISRGDFVGQNLFLMHNEQATSGNVKHSRFDLFCPRRMDKLHTEAQQSRTEDRIEDIPDGTAATPKQTSGWSGSASCAEINFDSGAVDSGESKTDTSCFCFA